MIKITGILETALVYTTSFLFYRGSWEQGWARRAKSVSKLIIALKSSKCLVPLCHRTSFVLMHESDAPRVTLATIRNQHGIWGV